MSSEIDVTPSPRLLQVLGDIPLQPWQCLAELIDNSLDEIARKPALFESEPLRVDISIEVAPNGTKTLVVTDNGAGMAKPELEIALRAGATTKARYGTLGLFGMGFNIATARLGAITTVQTTRDEDESSLQVVVDFAALQRSENFKVPLELVPKKSNGDHGTTIRVQLKPAMAEFFGSTKNLQTVRNQLGDVYSFLLRREVPGIRKEYSNAHLPAEIRVQGELVQPRLPCVWSDSRTVNSYGQPVAAIQYVDMLLTEATACLACGYWDRSNGPTECEECGSTNLEVRERRVWGWLGIQRYIDSAHFGVDFLRFGRKILKQDKNIFSYQDPDTLQVDVEYPIEMPANQGRIVGEIHLDHVPVTYQKNDFDRQHRDWQKAIEIVRGAGPLKPRAAEVANSSKLAMLFSAYRRNDPGYRYLTPGDGRNALHTKAREWASLFDKGVPAYLDDSIWFEAVRRHEEIKAGTTGQTSAEAPKPVKEGAVAEILGPVGPAGPAGTSVEEAPRPQQVVQSRAAQLNAARALGGPRTDLEGEFTLKHGLGTWRLTVLETSAELATPSGVAAAVTVGEVKGHDLEILVHKDHQIFREFGQGVRELAILQAAEVIRELNGNTLPTPVIYAELIAQVEDLRNTATAITDRIESVLSRVRDLMVSPVSNSPEAFWELLSSSEKQRVEEAAAVNHPTVQFVELVNSGNFVLLASGSALARFVRFAPTEFFDGRVFRPAFAARPPAARDRIVGKIARCLEGVSEFVEDTLMRQADDLQLATINVDTLASQIRSEDHHA